MKNTLEQDIENEILADRWKKTKAGGIVTKFGSLKENQWGNIVIYVKKRREGQRQGVRGCLQRMQSILRPREYLRVCEG